MTELSKEELFSIWQTHIVGDYRSRLELLSVVVNGLSETTLQVVFMNNLTEDIREEVKMLNPRSLKEMMDRAQQMEKNVIIDKKYILQPDKLHRRTQVNSIRYAFTSQTSLVYVISSPLTSNPSYKALTSFSRWDCVILSYTFQEIFMSFDIALRHFQF